ncbi:unnamed protein product, partial [Prorocentrum cordatum]
GRGPRRAPPPPRAGAPGRGPPHGRQRGRGRRGGAAAAGAEGSGRGPRGARAAGRVWRGRRARARGARGRGRGLPAGAAVPRRALPVRRGPRARREGRPGDGGPTKRAPCQRSCCSSWPRAPRPGGRREKERPHRSCPPAIGDVLSRGGWEVITAEEAGLRASRFVAHAEQRLARALEEQQQLAELLRREQLARQAAEAQARQASARADRAAQEALRAREATDSAWAEAQQARVECEKHRLLSKQLLYSELRREALEGGAEPYPYGVRVCDEDPVCLVAWQVGRPEPETRLLSCAVLRARLGEGRGRNSSPSLGEGPLAAPPGGRAAGPPALRL